MNEPVNYPQPLPDADSEGYWHATRAGVLAICRCQACHLWMHPPLERCRRCGGETSFEEVSRIGRVHSWIRVDRASVPGFEVPYYIVIVDLVEQPGVRIACVVGDDDPLGREPVIGDEVRLSVDQLPGGDFSAPTAQLQEVGNE
ncbi:OB-fold domain-containing protein [Mycolicibacterium elephantis]